MTAVCMVLGLAILLGVMATTAEQRRDIKRRWIKPLEPWAWGVTAAGVLLLAWDSIAATLRHLRQ